ncbi:protein FAR1-RELATED SEQUENCE 5-like [Spinacia oleracea]|uniref:Protein FAR1-RELATED SEQUENCE 5-like n=1 Tax=Spinacia oleracea TaxID=3562 RepID=A0A9R0I104_SPIOL|nr:protein FAR1-RELATED SEQUENCE 5-like [Spinacia oleracea]
MDEAEALFHEKFYSREELIQKARHFYASKGYGLSIKDSKKDKYVVLCCDRGGNYRNKGKIPIENRKRVTCTRLINCPFQIEGKLKGYFWSLQIKNNNHNHDPSDDMSGHPSSRCLTKEEIADIEKQSMAGIQPRQIISSLRQKNPNLQAVARTIYNLKNKIQKESLGSRSLIQALFEELEQGGFTFTYVKDDKGHLTHVFFAHPRSIMLAKTYSSVFVMDCTYKTNKYGMPLLDIIGMTSLNKSFYAAFVFLQNEKEEDYVWALKNFSSILGFNCQPQVIVTDRKLALIGAINIVFPETTHLLCVWHIQKNIVAKCKGYFTEIEDWDVFMSMWNAMIYAETEEQFEESWLFLQLIYKEKNDIIDYISSTWIPVKKKFVSVWTEKILHFGNRASSRAEGAHAKLKKYLHVSTGNIRQVKNKICLAIDNEFQEIKTQVESEKLRVPHKYNVPYFKDLMNKVSIFALKKLYKQYEMASLGTLKAQCTGNFVATMGLPCAHMMCDWKEGTLPLHLINSQWRIDTKFITSINEDNTCADDEDEMKELLDKLYIAYHQWPTFQKVEVKKKIYQLLNMEDPLVTEPILQTRKRKRNTKSKKGMGSSSTRRDPSQFEMVEAVWKSQNSQNVGETSTSGIDLNVPLFQDPSLTSLEVLK